MHALDQLPHREDLDQEARGQVQAAAELRLESALAAARQRLDGRSERALLALYYLGRRAETIEALRAFADGAYGRYRRDEARRLRVPRGPFV